MTEQIYLASDEILDRYSTLESDFGLKQQRMELTRNRLKLRSFLDRRDLKSQMYQIDLKISQQREIWSR